MKNELYFKRYPSRNGIPVSPLEIYELNDSDLNIKADRNWNLHHSCWTRTMFGRQVLYLTVRSLAAHQLFMPVDIHDQLHTEYDPPRMPTPLEAITELERAMDEGEQLRIRRTNRKVGRYAMGSITDDIFKRCKDSYDSLKRTG
jgi:hypothetical protein